VKVCRLLAEHRADLQATLEFGVTPLHMAAERGHGTVLRCLLEDLAERGPDAASAAAAAPRTVDRRSPWLAAAAEGHQPCCRQLWATTPDGGTLRSQQDRDGRFALLLAARGGHVETCEWLLEAGATSALDSGLEGRDLCGWTPLIAASAEGHKEAVRWLLKVRADLSAVDTDGRSARAWSGLRGHSAVEAQLRRAEEEAAARTK